MVSSSLEILKLHKNQPKFCPLAPYKPSLKPVNRSWDPSRSIELEKCFLMMVSRSYQYLSTAHFMPKQGQHKVFLGSGLAWLGLAWPGLAWHGHVWFGWEPHQQQCSYHCYDDDDDHQYNHRYDHQYHHSHDCQDTHHQHKYHKIHPYLQYEGDQQLIDGL